MAAARNLALAALETPHQQARLKETTAVLLKTLETEVVAVGADQMLPVQMEQVASVVTVVLEHHPVLADRL